LNPTFILVASTTAKLCRVLVGKITKKWQNFPFFWMSRQNFLGSRWNISTSENMRNWTVEKCLYAAQIPPRKIKFDARNFQKSVEKEYFACAARLVAHRSMQPMRKLREF
jgi:hypothetical protein